MESRIQDPQWKKILHPLFLFIRANMGAIIWDEPEVGPFLTNLPEPIPVCIKSAPKEWGAGGVFVKDIQNYSEEELGVIIRDSNQLVELHPFDDTTAIGFFELRWYGHGSHLWPLASDLSHPSCIKLGHGRVAHSLAFILKELGPLISEWHRQKTSESNTQECCPACVACPRRPDFHRCLFEVSAEQLMILELRSLGPGCWEVIVGSDGLGYEETMQICDGVDMDHTIAQLQQASIDESFIDESFPDESSNATTQSSEGLQAEAQNLCDLLKSKLSIALDCPS